MVGSFFGDRIKEIRHKLNIKQVDFIKAIGVHIQTLSKYENNKVEPGADVLRRIAVSFPVSSAWLLTGEGEIDIGYKPEPKNASGSDLHGKLDVIMDKGDRSQRSIVRGIIDTVFDEFD
jgi:transcriptional regulator with XRE-family HTH domain